VSECDREASISRRPWPTRGCRTVEENKAINVKYYDCACIFAVV
jgi:hypothetical protein